MPSPGDVLEIRFISEQQGVQMQTTLFWELDSIGGTPPTIPQAMAALAAAYVDTVRAQMSDQWSVTCVIYRNVTDPSEAQVPVFVSEAGTDTGEPHAANKVVRITRYAPNAGLTEIKRSSISLSGLNVGVSHNGTVRDDMELGTIEAWLKNDVTVPADGWLLTPKIRYNSIAPAVPPVYEYATVTQCIQQGTFRTLARRNTALCGVS